MKYFVKELCALCKEGQKNGAAIIVARPELRHYSQPVDVMAATWKIVNMLLEDEHTQIYGIAIIKDFSNLKIFDSDSFQNIVVNIKTPLQMAESLHKGIPGRIAAVNFTNQPAIFDLVYCMLLPCFDESTNNRFFVHRFLRDKNYCAKFLFFEKNTQ